MKKRLVIIGNGMATGRLLQRLFERADHSLDVTVFSEEPGGSYNRVLLSNLLSGELDQDKVITLPPEWYTEHGVTLHSQDPAVQIDRANKVIISAAGVHVHYDLLVIATGSYPTPLPVDGAQLDGVMSFRTLKDVERMKQIAKEKKQAVVIGGGFLGLEAAEGLRAQGMDVTLLHRGSYLLDHQLDDTAGELLLNALEARGLKFRIKANTQTLQGSDRVRSVRLTTGETLPADLVVTAIGVTPNKALASDSGLKCERGILVDAQMNTSDPAIYSLGECCQFESFTYGLVAPIWQQAEILVSSLLNEANTYKEEAVATQLKISGVALFSCGSLQDSPETETMIYHDIQHNEYRKLWLKDNRLVGAVLYGDVREGQWYFDQLKQKTDLSANRQQLLFGSPFCSQDTQTQDMGISSMTTSTDSQKKQLVVIGNGMVGHHFIENFVASEIADEYDIHILAEESRAAYDRVHLSEYFGDSTYQDLCLVEDNFYETHGVQLHLSEGATQIDRDTKQVITEQASYPYDTLVLATGSYPFVPPIPGNDGDACFVYRTLEDLDKIQACAKAASVGVVVGGGLLGLEAANALKSLGLKAHVVEFAPRLMPVQLDEDGGELLKKKIEALDVDVHCNKATSEIVPGEEHTYRMNFSDGSYLETDLILFSAGIRPQDTLARNSDLTLGERGGIMVNNQCCTSDDNIYAIGECALWNNQIFGLVAPGYTMAKTAVAAIAGKDDSSFTGADMSTKLKLLGVDVGSIGDAHGKTPGSISYRYLDEDSQVYYRIVVSEDRKKLLGAVLVGDNSKYDTLIQYALNGIDLPEKPQALILPALDGSSAPSLGPDALPDSATICSCLNVTKGQICCSIDEGAATLGDVKEVTKAASGCGGCAAMLKNIVDHELEKRGVEVCKDICEHFAYTREELYHIV
ncbi:nitrite reductase large subunit NirB, partial [Neptuniibacter pectenicola]|uniref:nitrite reductase large subunit NirB n=1 Tax=Neptuniibacter pectenicola TaxID=1806669 RepID=UPI0030EEF821